MTRHGTARGRTPIALTIAGSDSGGGAGIQADLKTFSALDVYGCSVITALTAQNTCSVDAVLGIAPEFVTRQITSVFADIPVTAVKIGMLADVGVMKAVRSALEAVSGGPPPIVLDPVMVAKSGDALLPDSALAGLKDIMLPIADIVTPNVPELVRLVDWPTPIRNLAEMEDAARNLMACGPRAVLAKGGHLDADHSTDLWLDRDGALPLARQRIDTRNTHGTGCTLSAAVAAGLARGADRYDAVMQAKDYISAAIAAADGLYIGRGHGPVHHFYRQWQNTDKSGQKATRYGDGEVKQ